ncbi:MAG: class II fructose-bisphosphate aldolase family protein [Patescibacteria group bacterium]|jgi:fructose-bisphosphate aldolase class II|nr:class II fructose-bisphosphate aldolase family protein [Patescibacteria group bacterium]
MRAKTIDILKKAKKEGYAVGAFNTSNMEVTQGIIRAAAKLSRPCVIQATISSLDYVGDKMLKYIVLEAIESDSKKADIGFHLDHGKALNDVRRAINSGVDSVMIDGSKLDFEENLTLTKEIVQYAHSKGVAVQAELGKVPYLGREEMGEIDWDELMTNPEEAKILVKETGIDALAVGIGNAHGFFRERSEPDWERLDMIRSLAPEIPLIMHGASDWDKEKVQRAIKGGVCCFNIDTDTRIAFSTALCGMMRKDRCDYNDPRKIMAVVRDAVQKKVEEKIEMFAMI